MNITINAPRLLRSIQELGHIGENENGGVDRSLASEADFEAREWLKAFWRNNMKLEARTDPAANLWLTWENGQTLRPLVIGSHHDAVPDGGKYDGALGVLMASEIMKTLMEYEVVLRHPLTVVSFTGEEPSPYNVSTLGSKILCGRLDSGAVRSIRHRESGEPLSAGLARLGGDASKLDDARLKPGFCAAFLECHIEQGRRLETAGISTAAVSCITGIYREKIFVHGQANHAGTTCMCDRSDALLGASELALGLESIAGKYDDIVATCGYARVLPNEASIIPGEVQMIIDVRTCHPARLKQFLAEFGTLSEQTALKRGLKIERSTILDQAPVPMDSVVQSAVQAGCRTVGEPSVLLESMAGHDAANMARLTRSGMLFVQSVGGKSHCRQEYTRPEDIEKAGNAMLAAVLELDRRLD